MTAWQRMTRAGIHQALVPGIEPPFQPATICREAGLRFAFGMHPQSTAPLDWRSQLERALERHQPAAVGEFGWDRRGGTDFSRVRAQLELAQKQKLPVILHLVGHCPGLLEAVNAYDLTAQLHRCTGRPQRFKSFWESGHYISIGPRLRGTSALPKRYPPHKSYWKLMPKPRQMSLGIGSLNSIKRSPRPETSAWNNSSTWSARTMHGS